MKITVNLIPEKRKKEIKKRRLSRFIVWQEFLVIFALLVFTSLLFSINFILKIELENVQKLGEDNTSKNEFIEVRGYEDEFKRINKEVSLIRSIQKNDFYWTNIFYELSGNTPDNIVLESLNTNENKVSLLGQSATRDNLIDFKNNLEASDCFYGVDVPLSDIVIKEDIDFEMVLFINKDCLKLKKNE
ncbi:PilN domain-containing protein [Patescibacteria group bacterium]